MIEVKLRLWLTLLAPICAISGMARVAADGVDLVLDHLHPMVGQSQRQLDVVRGVEPGVGQAVEDLHLVGRGFVPPSH